MAIEVRRAGPEDVPVLVGLMQAFYAEADFPLAPEPAAAAFEALLADPRLGSIWLAFDKEAAIGHLVLTVCFSMEYGGPRGFVDDLYVRPDARGCGAGAKLLSEARGEAARGGVRALHVEVGPDNAVARRVYARAGFADSGHLLLTLPLATPVHVN